MSIADMNALPDISGNDSERLQEFARVTAREVKAVGGASAGTTLEMIGYIRELEHTLTNTRAAVAGPRGDAATIARNRDEAQDIIMASEEALGQCYDAATRHDLASRITEALDAATSSPTPAESDEKPPELLHVVAMLCQSGGYEPRVTLRFKELEDAQVVHQWLVKLVHKGGR